MGEDFVFETRANDVKKADELSLTLLLRISCRDAMTDVLLQLERQLQVDHDRVRLRHFQLKYFERLVHVGQNEGQLAENIRIYDGTDKQAERYEDGLCSRLWHDVAAYDGPHGDLQRIQVLRHELCFVDLIELVG